MFFFNLIDWNCAEKNDAATDNVDDDDNEQDTLR